MCGFSCLIIAANYVYSFDPTPNDAASIELTAC